MNRILKKSPLLLLIGAFLFIQSCKTKEDNLVLPDQLGSNPANPSTDSFLVITATIAEDSFITSSLPYQLLGAMNDPRFGTSKSEVYSQFTITDLTNSLNDPSNTLDSAVLVIRLTSKTAFYGNLTTAQNITVHRLTAAFPAATSVYSSQKLVYDPIPIGTFTGKISLEDSTTVRNGNGVIKIAPSLKIKLSSSFANELFNAPAGSYASDLVFKSFLKGIVLKVNNTPANGDGAIFALTTDDNLSKITVFFNDSLQYNLNMKSSRSFANYQVINQPAEINNQKTNASADYNTLYLQSLTGSKIQVTLPGLAQLAAGKPKVIHKAELIVKPLAGSFDANYPLPQRLLVLQPNDQNQSVAIPDLFTGKFNGNRKNNNDYVLNITDFMQFQINQFRNNAQIRNVLHIVIPNSDPITPSRIVIDANKLPANRQFVLRVIYSEL